jgi:hypothetical protein
MPVTEIVKEIDAYLLSLRQARDLLLAPAIKPALAVPTLPKRRAMIDKTTAAPTRRLRAQKVSPPTAANQIGREAVKNRAAANSVPRPASPVIHRELAPRILQSEPAQPAPNQTVATQEVQISNPIVSRVRTAARVIRSKPRKAPKPAASPKEEVVKPAIALAGSMNSKIVVLSAEEARRQRDRTPAAPEVKRPRVPSTGLSGKLAFEALFSDMNDSRKSS